MERRKAVKEKNGNDGEREETSVPCGRGQSSIVDHCLSLIKSGKGNILIR